MKKFILMICFLSLMFPLKNLRAEKNSSIQELMKTFLYALSIGCDDQILSFLTEPILSEKKDLFIDNSAYSRFLQKMYEGSVINLINVANVDDITRIVDVEILFKNETAPIKLKYKLKYELGRWKISEEYAL